jgi:hypothetical protein
MCFASFFFEFVRHLFPGVGEPGTWVLFKVCDAKFVAFLAWWSWPSLCVSRTWKNLVLSLCTRNRLM